MPEQQTSKEKLNRKKRKQELKSVRSDILINPNFKLNGDMANEFNEQYNPVNKVNCDESEDN